MHKSSYGRLSKSCVVIRDRTNYFSWKGIGCEPWLLEAQGLSGSFEWIWYSQPTSPFQLVATAFSRSSFPGIRCSNYISSFAWHVSSSRWDPFRSTWPHYLNTLAIVVWLLATYDAIKGVIIFKLGTSKGIWNWPETDRKTYLRAGILRLSNFNTHIYIIPGHEYFSYSQKMQQQIYKDQQGPVRLHVIAIASGFMADCTCFWRWIRP